MPDQSLTLICPSATPSDKSEAEIFGAMVWLWMQSRTHRNCPLRELERLLMPALKTGQFVLAIQSEERQQPVGLMTWAWLTAEMEQRYLQSLDRTLAPSDWEQGDRPWILDWIAPFGHTRVIARMTRQLLSTANYRTLYHRGDETGLKLLHFKGSRVSQQQEKDFWAARPLLGQQT